MLLFAVILIVVGAGLIILGLAGALASWLIYLGIFIGVIAIVLLVVPAISGRRNRQL